MKEILPPPSEESEFQPNNPDQNNPDVHDLNDLNLNPLEINNQALPSSQTIEPQTLPPGTEEKVITTDQIPQLLETDQQVTLLSDLSQGKTEKTQIPISAGNIKRMLKIFQNKDIPFLKIAIGGVAVTVALRYGIKKGRKVKEKVDKFLDKKRIASLDGEQMDNFEQLVENNYDVVHRYLSRNLIGNPKTAKNITHDVFQRALASYSKYTPREDLKKPDRAWLLRIAHNLLANYFRDKKRLEKREIPLDYTSVSDLEEKGIILSTPIAIHALELQITDTPKVTMLIRKIIAQLPDDRKQLICLKHEFHLSNAEIGFIMNRSEGAIKALYHRTLETLRKQLEAQLATGNNEFT